MTDAIIRLALLWVQREYGVDILSQTLEKGVLLNDLCQTFGTGIVTNVQISVLGTILVYTGM